MEDLEDIEYKKWKMKLYKKIEEFFKEIPYETLEISCNDKKVSITFDDLLYDRLNINIIENF